MKGGGETTQPVPDLLLLEEVLVSALLQIVGAHGGNTVGGSLVDVVLITEHAHPNSGSRNSLQSERT